jgi:non-ribosomal peptide synthetase component F
MLAVLRAGGAFVPLDPSHPVERLRHLCESVGANVVLCSGHLGRMLVGVVGTVLPVNESIIAEPDRHPEPNNRPPNISAVSSTNAAYIIFTSGSTGKPKVSTYTATNRDVSRD